MEKVFVYTPIGHTFRIINVLAARKLLLTSVGSLGVKRLYLKTSIRLRTPARILSILRKTTLLYSVWPISIVFTLIATTCAQTPTLLFYPKRLKKSTFIAAAKSLFFKENSLNLLREKALSPEGVENLLR